MENGQFSEAQARAAREVAALNTALDAAGLDPVKLDAIYLQFIGYSPISEGSTDEPQETRETLQDYARELCFAAGIPCPMFS